jgi:hypothetical protein
MHRHYDPIPPDFFFSLPVCTTVVFLRTGVGYDYDHKRPEIYRGGRPGAQAESACMRNTDGIRSCRAQSSADFCFRPTNFQAAGTASNVPGEPRAADYARDLSPEIPARALPYWSRRPCDSHRCCIQEKMILPELDGEGLGWRVGQGHGQPPGRHWGSGGSRNEGELSRLGGNPAAYSADRGNLAWVCCEPSGLVRTAETVAAWRGRLWKVGPTRQSTTRGDFLAYGFRPSTARVQRLRSCLRQAVSAKGTEVTPWSHVSLRQGNVWLVDYIKKKQTRRRGLHEGLKVIGRLEDGSERMWFFLILF